MSIISMQHLKESVGTASRVVLFLLLLCPLLGQAQIGVSPRMLVVNLDEQPRGHSFRLLNMSERDVEVEVSLANWRMDEQNQPVVIAPEQDSLDQWLIVNPLRFSVPAGQSQTVRLAFRPQQQLAAGEYRSMLYFTQVVDPETEDTAMFRSRFRIGAAIYAHTGASVEDLTTSDFVLRSDVASPALLLDVDNRGNRHVRMDGVWSLWHLDAYPGDDGWQLDSAMLRPDAALPDGMLALGKLSSTPVLPGTQRTLVTGLDLPPAEQRQWPLDVLLVVQGRLGEQQLQQRIELPAASLFSAMATPQQDQDGG